MAVLVRDKSFLFIMVPHTGCTAVGKALLTSAGGEFLPAQPIKNASGKIVVPRKHNTLPQLLGYGVLAPQDRMRLLVAGTVRNPFDWLVSQYLRFLPVKAGDESGLVKTATGHIQGDPRYQGAPEEFEAWLVSRYRRRRRGPFGRILPTSSRKHVDWLEGVDAVLRFERLQETFDQVLARVGVEQHIHIPVLNETVSRHGRDFREWYTPAGREIAEEAFAGYLKRYGYAFEGPPARTGEPPDARHGSPAQI
jgi:hypothetical protein